VGCGTKLKTTGLVRWVRVGCGTKLKTTGLVRQ